MSGAIWQRRPELRVVGSACAFPEALLTTDELVGLLESRFGFRRGKEALVIARRLNIQSRHVCRAFQVRHEAAASGQSNPDLAARAVRDALDQAGLRPNDLGYLIGHSTTPHQPLPPNIALVADRLGYGGPYVELRQACTGFANALMIASGLLAASDAAPVAIVGSETGSLFLDPHRLDDDSSQIVNMLQMGDGAGAVILAPAGGTGAAIKACWFGTMGLGREPGIQLRSGALEFGHDYAGVAAHGPALIAAGANVLGTMGYPVGSIDIIVPHQASGRVPAQVAAGLGIPGSQVFGNAARIGNTGSAAIWIALAELLERDLTSGTTIAALGAEASKYMHGGFVYRHG